MIKMDIWIHRIKDKNHLMRLSLQKHCEACTILCSFYRLKNLGSTEVGSNILFTVFI